MPKEIQPETPFPAAEKTGPVRFLELDALRGLAAVFVILFHLSIGRRATDYGLELGVTGVDLFFIISGFVIFLTLSKTRTWRGFAVNRCSRLYPTYWTCVSFTALLVLAKSENVGWDFLSRYLANLTMFQVYLRQENLDGPYWTMLVEMLFYIYMAAVYQSRLLGKIELVGAITLLPVCIYGTPFFGDRFPAFHEAVGIWFPLINHFPLFLSGILFYRLKTAGTTPARVMLLIACFGCQALLFDDGGMSRNYLPFRQYLPMIALYYACFLAYTYGRLKFIVNRATLFLGGISYSAYLVHQFLSLKILMPFFIGHTGGGFFAAAALTILAVCCIAALITHFVEKPMMVYFRRKAFPVGVTPIKPIPERVAA